MDERPPAVEERIETLRGDSLHAVELQLRRVLAPREVGAPSRVHRSCGQEHDAARGVIWVHAIALGEAGHAVGMALRTCVAEIAEDRARLHGGELVGVPQQDQARLGVQRAEQAVHHRQVDHRALVDQHHLRGQRVALVVPELAARRVAQQAVQRGRGRRVQASLPEGSLHAAAQSVGGLARGRGEGDVLHRFTRLGEGLEDGDHDGRLAGARPAGDERQGTTARHGHRAELLFAQRDR